MSNMDLDPAGNDLQPPPPPVPTYPLNDVNINQWIEHEGKQFLFPSKCRLCSSFPKPNNHDFCGWLVNSKGVRHGCELCRRWGLVCVVGNVVLPPHPDEKLSTFQMIPYCDPCEFEKTKCDRQHPCDCCVKVRKNPAGCIRNGWWTQNHGPGGARYRPGSFTRGAAFGAELYPYISGMLGGPDGVNSDQPYNAFIDQPPDFHLQYLAWVRGGPMPVPAGYPEPPPVPRPLLLPLRSLEEEDEQLQQQPEQVVAPPNIPSPPAPIPTLIPNPDLLPIAGYIPPNPNRAPRHTEVAILHTDILLQPLATPQRRQTILRVGEDLHPPPSPGPSKTLFDVDQIPVIMRRARLALPRSAAQHIDQHMQHPNPTAKPALDTVSSALRSMRQNKYQRCDERNTAKNRVKCTNPTREVCTDKSHDGSPPRICDDCHAWSRRVMRRAIRDTALRLRAYACSPCAARISTDWFLSVRYNVWGLPPDAFADHTGADAVSNSRGQPLKITGCMCATKLIDGRLCTPHRLAHFLDVRDKAAAMREFIIVTFGALVCPFCVINPGANPRNTREGQLPPKIAYVCLACFGFVFADPAGLAAIGPFRPVAPPPPAPPGQPAPPPADAEEAIDGTVPMEL